MQWFLVDEPGLVGTIVACPVGNDLVIPVLNFPDIHALSTCSSEVSSATWVVRKLLVWLVSPWSDHYSLSGIETLSVLVGDSIVLLGECSDGICSSVI